MTEDVNAAEPAGRPPESAAVLVAALWRGAASAAWEPGRWPRDPDAPHAGAPLHAMLHALAARADVVAAGTVDGERVAARLLAETARAVDAVLHGVNPAGAGPAASRESGHGLAPAAHLRLARMERWLAARAATDPAAGPAADLCLWMLEHVEFGPPTAG